MRECECPYCGDYTEINHDDGYGYEEGEAFNQECEHCGKTFVYYTTITHTYDAHQAPCLNGESHKWKPIVGFPSGWLSNFHRCEYCAREETIDSNLRYNHDTDSWRPKDEESKSN